MKYIDGFVIPVPQANKQAYLDIAKMAAPVFMEHGATRIVECWGDDLMKGKTNDFFTAVVAEPGETVVFSWIEWPDKATRDAGNEKIMADERLMPAPGQEMPFSGKRMIYSGFVPILDTQDDAQ